MSGVNLGGCCMCSGPGARNILMLHRRAPVAGHGWGCAQCGLPPDGAAAVLCDECLDLYAEKPDLLEFCCRGYPAIDGRIAIADLPPGDFDHDMSKHEQDERDRQIAESGAEADRG
jgi:hypothetical protein